MIVYNYYIFLSFLCYNFAYMIFVFCLREKQTKNKKNYFFYLNRTWMTLTQARGTLSNISLPLKRKIERGREVEEGGYAYFLQVQKHLQIEK